MKERKIRKNEYLPHPELNMGSWKGMWGMMIKLHVPFYIFLMFYQDYFPLLATLDLVLIASMILYSLAVRPLMMRGVLNAYYRRTYSSPSMVIWMFLFVGSTLRTSMLGLYYAFTFTWISGDESMKRWNYYVQDFSDKFSDKAGLVIGILLSVYFLYSFFYREGFISIKEFSNRVVTLMRARNYSYLDASNKVLSDKSFELEQQALEHVKYDKDEEDVFAHFFGHQNKTVSSPSSASSASSSYEKKAPFVPMRRQARK
ncbi:hypothetical protein NDS46_31145 (plasmid) [Paenibacillus thiaminolyticus]|uniref:hypothetical protein n=1 Tax=Paenibacillus thiaminolyticus TaxID=49283 RepID=UPI00232A9B0D|nr:hypothetical protein [Paenibacillus thiaminolyticus]WCF11415.1 hypothetical protein NDS46_31145 [Paenibacillus thiaminolyticus]